MWQSMEAPPVNHAKNYEGGYLGWMKRLYLGSGSRGGTMRAMGIPYQRVVQGWTPLSQASVLDYVVYHHWSAFCVQWVALAWCMLVGAE